MDKTAIYRGRFAPSPSGPLHFGSLIAALGSWLDARAVGGEWLLRIEDVDAPRTVAGAETAIMAALEAFGLHWDGSVLCQRDRDEAYAAALEFLRARDDAYPCACTRSEIEAAASRRAADGAWVYPGTCRAGLPPGLRARAWRLRLPAGQRTFVDRLQGRVAEDPARDVGDVVLKRADGLFAYQLAVVVDDAWQGITDVVRGADLLDSTLRQIVLQDCLGVPTPRYLHLPVAVNAAGEKLAKQTRAPALDLGAVSATLTRALEFLGHPPPAELSGAPAVELLTWAMPAWSMARLPPLRSIVSTQRPRP